MAGRFIILMLFLSVATNKYGSSVYQDEKTRSESHLEENYIDKKESCLVDSDDKSCSIAGSNIAENKYSREVNQQWSKFLHQVEQSAAVYKPCDPDKCNCHYGLIKKDLKTFKSGISQHMVNTAKERGTYYQIINHQLYRSKECMFPSRCAGVEHFILKLVDKLPDMDFVINTRDYPQVNKMFGDLKPIFSFSKTGEYADITYPAWTFWEGGPAISLYPRGLGRWDIMRKEITESSKLLPWDKKEDKAFFRGSRTNSERDPLVYLSRKEPHRVDAQYTKNQAWKSDADTLYAPPAEEVSLSDHCRYKYLFNFRGVAASFRLKHLFLCGSLVFHVGEDWIEFFYPKLKPWVHYIPVPPKANEQYLEMLITFAQENSEIVEKIASQGQDFIIKHLRMKDVLCYWKKLLSSYAALLSYKPKMDENLIHISVK